MLSITPYAHMDTLSRITRFYRQVPLVGKQ